ncbi:hypothetical protein PAXINDRAFT_19859 [Paxillus involutus ATCC 200175]|uniref:Unplaced genomic scaffold PAXINscaffold_767, whole genome shotgun sequence n=1 Tax=Paxillus involutus ATCC 200175 TaxID=664439 RepID=A0A0C9T6P2_PAXIN|nr:hypothetical protein PAXINDRAFT_19859 [Paxillus involutus ATCC 200175]
MTFDGQLTCQRQPTDPLEVLPPELVGYVFHLWLLDSVYPHTKCSDSQLPVLLCLVSKSWRDFVYASPLLWAHVILETSQGATPNLHALQKRLERSQSAPLFLDILIGEQPDRDALRVLLAESSRFCHLTLGVFDQSWCGDIPTQGFTQLRKLTVHTGFQIRTDVALLSAIFSSAPRLRSVNWFSTGDPGLVGVNGHQLHSLDLTVFHLPVTRLLEVLVACQNLRDVAVTFQGEHEYTAIAPRERILLLELRSLVLDGTGHLACILRSIQAPLLSRIDIKWWHYNGRQCGLEALHSFLAYSPNLEEIALRKLLDTEDGLISIITNNKNLLRLTVAAERWQTSFITGKTFELLTRQEHGKYALPHLENLVFRGGLDVPDEVILRMIESRMSPPDDVKYSSCSRRACTLKSICLDGCKPMAEETISSLETICLESGLEAEGTFASRNHTSIPTSTIATEARTPYFSFFFDSGALIFWLRNLLLGRR